MRKQKLFLLAVSICLPALCQAEASCPWINAATAGGILGGSVSAHATVTMDDGSCVFTRQGQSVPDELRVEVKTIGESGSGFAPYAARCGAHATPLQAIGNETLSCSLGRKSGQQLELAVGRVRDHVFLIRIGMSDSSVTQDSLRKKVRIAAEQVAGNLF